MQHNIFDWTAGYATRRMPVFGRNVVSTSHPVAAQVGMQMLARGGNAVDAAIAAAAAITLLEPVSNGLGSDCFAILWDGKGLAGLNASGPAPMGWSRAYFAARYGADAKAPPARGWDAVTVPGAVAGWVALSERYGRLPFADLLEPAAEIAERGWLVSTNVQSKWAQAADVPDLVSQPGFAQAFLPHGRAPHVGEHFALPGAARMLRAIGQTRGGALYGGEIAEAIEARAKAEGGAMRASDLAAYRPEWVTPIGHDYRGYRLHEIPPNGQGITALIALGILSHFDLSEFGPDSLEGQHLQIEAIKLAFADVYAHVADPASMRITPEQMLDDAYLAQRARLIDPRRAQLFASGHAPRGGTIYLTAADADGMMISFIQSNYMGFGSGIVLPEWGLSLQNRGAGFSLDPGHANCVMPGRRPFHTIIPAFLTRDGAPVMSFGVMGGNMQPQGHVQTLVRMLDHRQNPQAACDAPRWRFDNGRVVNIEATMSEGLEAGLRALGHDIAPIRDSYMDFGAGQFIWRMGDPGREGYAAASDPRRDGQAVVL
jgi:gamma-glutamyltranspeptidase/glutathione hydrolase